MNTPSTPVISPNEMPYLPAGERRHETTDVNAKWVLLFAMGIVIGALLTHLVLWVFLQGLALTEPRKERRPQPPADARFQGPVEPCLETDEANDLKQLRTEEGARLMRYEWKDKSAGIVRVPIARAMELIEQRGLPDWKPQGPTELTPDAFGNVRIGGKPLDRKADNEP